MKKKLEIVRIKSNDTQIFRLRHAHGGKGNSLIKRRQLTEQTCLHTLLVYQALHLFECDHFATRWQHRNAASCAGTILAPRRLHRQPAPCQSRNDLPHRAVLLLRQLLRRLQHIILNVQSGSHTSGVIASPHQSQTADFRLLARHRRVQVADEQVD